MKNPIDFDDSLLIEDYVTAERLCSVCPSKWKPTAFDMSVHLTNVHNSTVFCKTEFGIQEFFDIMRRNQSNGIIRRVVTHNADVSIDKHLAGLRPPNVPVWYAANSTYSDPSIIPVPLGLANEYRDVTDPPTMINTQVEDILEVDTRQSRDRLLYVNHRNHTYPVERKPLMESFLKRAREGHRWFTISPLCSDGYPEIIRNREGNRKIIKIYLEEMTRHKFVLCPRGNGVDTHRLWEALYSRTIPVVRYEDAHRNFKDLPILFVNDWSEVTEEFLHTEYSKMCSRAWDYSKMSLKWWAKQFE